MMPRPLDDAAAESITIRGRRINIGVSGLDGEAFFREQWNGVAEGKEEPEQYELLDRVLTESSIFVDCGAYMGARALYAARLGARVVAFEPDPVARAVLTRCVEANPDLSVQVIAAAVGPTDGTLTLGSIHGGGNAGSSALIMDPKTTWEVPVVGLAGWIAAEQLDRQGLVIKIDVEGGEYTLLPSLVDLARRARPVVLLELHPHLIAQQTRGQSLPNKVWRRARLLRAHWGLRRFFSAFPNVRHLDGSRTSLFRIMRRFIRSSNLPTDARYVIFSFDEHRPV